jgi:hypothetical protein
MKKFLFGLVFCFGIFGGVSDGHAQTQYDYDDITHLYSQDEESVYYNNRKIEGALPSSFEILEYGYYAKDKNSAYYHGTKIEGADPQTFIFLENHYAKDKNAVYDNGRIVNKNIDPATVEILGAFIADKDFIYFWGERLEDIERESFEEIGGIYSKDRNGVYYWGLESFNEVENADLETFEVFEEYDFCAKDKNNVYCPRIRSDLDVNTFHFLNQFYSKDKNGIYITAMFPTKAPNIDLETFEVFGETEYGRDKNGFYERGSPIKYSELPDRIKNDPNYFPISIGDPPEAFGYSSFSDVSASNLHLGAINFVRMKGIVSGYEIDGKQYFKPENKINRAEFMKIVLLAKYAQEDIDSAPSAGFTDIPAGEWYENYANFGKQKGFIRGYKQANGTFAFGGEQSIKFAEAAKIVVNILIEPTDSSTTGNWYDSFVQKLQKKNVQTYAADKEITRGEMAEIISGILN